MKRHRPASPPSSPFPPAHQERWCVRTYVRRNFKPRRRSGRTVCDPLCAARAVRAYYVRGSVVCMSNVTALFAVQRGFCLAAVCHFFVRTPLRTCNFSCSDCEDTSTYTGLGEIRCGHDHAKGKNAPVAPVPPSLHERTYVCCSMLCHVRTYSIPRGPHLLGTYVRT